VTDLARFAAPAIRAHHDPGLAAKYEAEQRDLQRPRGTPH
jgi:hypothetical protein